jgi:ribonuclease Z
VLTLADGGKKSLAIHGSSGLQSFFRAVSKFLYRPDLTLSLVEVVDPLSVRCRDCEVKCIPFHSVAANAISYVCETPPKPGKFDVEKAVGLGIPKGPLFAKLKNGEDVTLADGRIISPHEVVEKQEDGKCCAVICKIDLLDVLNFTSDQNWERLFFMITNNSTVLTKLIDTTVAVQNTDLSM